MQKRHCIRALFLLIPSWLQAQEIPSRYKDTKLVKHAPPGYELPLELMECFPLIAPDAGGLSCSLRARKLDKKFFVKEVLFANARVNGKPVDLSPHPASFSTQFTGPVALESLNIPLTPAEVREATQSGGVQLQSDVYLVISPSLVEMLRFRAATTVLLALPLDVRVRLTSPEAEVSSGELARYYAPVLYQQTNDRHRDLITRFDYDGNWLGSDNAENVTRFPLPATVYYSVVQTRTHYFIGYYFYHPEDYVKVTGPACGFFNRVDAHENDLEGVQLVVEKGDSRYGNLLFMETLAHDVFYQLEASDRVLDRRDVRGVLEDIDVTSRWKSTRPGSTPCSTSNAWGTASGATA